MILVTGGTGFVGAYLLVELTGQNKPIKALKRAKSSTAYTEKIFAMKLGADAAARFARITWVEGDIMDVYSVEEAMQDADEVYHCAAEVSLRDYDPDDIIYTAEKGTANVVNIALEKGVKKLCHVSSIAALGENDEGKEINEEAFEEFSYSNSPYAIGKHLAEAQVWRAHAEGLNVVVVCPTIILGPWPGRSGSMAFFYSLKKQHSFYPGGTAGFVDVNDVVAIIFRLMNENKLNERYIINAENISYHTLFADITQSMGIKPPGIKIGKMGMKTFSLINNLFGGTKISSTMIEHSCGAYLYSNKKVVKELGYSFKPVKQSIEETAKFLHSYE
ncbi:MAG: NAD-dependent epimerase/dehydratase family protein [Bacteroidia bacterium]